MPRRAKSAKPRPERPADTAPPGVTVRMLVGACAGQTVRVTHGEAVRMCTGWQPTAELVAVNPAETRETR